MSTEDRSVPITSDRPSRDKRRAARAEAAAWIVRLHGSHRTPDLEAGFRTWLAADAENGRQFERVTEIWEAGATPVPGVARVGSYDESPTTRTGVSANGRRGLAAALMLAVIGAGIWVTHYFLLDPAYSTGVGEQRLVRLDDGSRAALNSASRIRIAYGEAERRVLLEEGEVFFEVARDPTRPFTVIAGDHRVTAVGTSFVVRYESDRTAITLIEGRVAVELPGRPADSADMPRRAERPEAESAAAAIGGDGQIVLSPGQRLTLSHGSSARVDEPPIDAVVAWRRGEVVLDSTSLADAVAEMNRYDETKLVIEDPRIAQLPISGIYHAGNSDAFATTVARLYGLEVVRGKDRIRLLPAASEAP